MAFHTGVRYGLSVTTTGWAGCSNGEKSLTSGNLPDSPAVPTGLGLRARFAAAAMALRTGFRFLNFDFGFGTKGRFHESKRQIIAKVCPPLRS